MAARRLLLSIFFVAAACSAEPNDVAQGIAQHESVAARIAALADRKPLNYADAAHWGCSPLTDDDVCDTPIRVAVQVTDGTTTSFDYSPASEPPADCFYIYPTVDLSMRGGNHDQISDVILPRGVIAYQGAPFGAACRVFAPFYRQATLGSYSERPDRAAPIFLNAMADVAAAFEYYLAHWNQGRPIIVLGHSQGAQMASYLLHSYFDGSAKVTSLPDSETSDLLRARLVAALPIGFSVFTPYGERVGGSFSDLPLCEAHDEPGCVISYRTYAEGQNFFGRSFGADIDAAMAEMGLLNRAIDRGDALACVNPAIGMQLAPSAATDANGLPVKPGDIRLLQGTWVVTNPLSGVLITPGRYAATCREDVYSGGYLAVSLHDPAPQIDQRGDPLGVTGTGSSSPLGLHTSDFHLPMGDLVELVRRKTAAHLARQ